jgi:peptidoglycan hydrolase-like protein with peptidoglycan-binding domain
VAQVQRILSRQGFYQGPIDGSMGSRTFYAIRAWQRSHNLHADGQINQELLSSMGLS